MNLTTYYKLQKQLSNEKYNVGVPNANADIIDSALNRHDLKDVAIETAINNEISRAKSAEQSIGTDLTLEINRAKSAENLLSRNLTAEETRAIASENQISEDLSDEVARAILVESVLQTTINTNKPVWDDKYTKNEVDNKFSALETAIDWKEAVNTFADIARTYPNPDDGWTVNVKDTDYTYRYSGSSWIAISANAIPKATQSVDGLLSKDDKVLYDDANGKKHTHANISILNTISQMLLNAWNSAYDKMHDHSNKSVLDGITSTLITAWNNAVSHISDSVKHITSDERPYWNSKEGAIKDVSAKSSIVDADNVPLIDSSASNTTKKVTWALIKSTLKTYFDTIYNMLALGETSTTAYRGDRGKTAYDHSQTSHAPSSAEKNIIIGVQRNNTDLSPDTNRKVNVVVPTKTSELTNDKGFITAADVDTSSNHVHPNKDILDKITDKVSEGFPLIIGTQTASTNIWTGNASIEKLYDGLCINYYLPYTGTSTGATLNLTLANKSTTGAIPCYYRNSTALTTHIAQYGICQLIYRSSLGSVTTPGWWLQTVYDADTTDRLYYSNTLQISDTLYRYKLISQDLNGEWRPFFITDKTSTTVVSTWSLSTAEFLIGSPILYYNSTTNLASSGTTSALYSSYPFDIRYNINVASLIAYTPLLLKGTMGSNGGFVLASSYYSSAFPTTDDGFLYMYIGYMYSTTNCRLVSDHPVYYFKEGMLRQFIAGSNYAEIAGESEESIKLKNARNVRTNLASTSTASFNGTSDITPGVTGILPITNGGTGTSTGNSPTATKATQDASGNVLTTSYGATIALSGQNLLLKSKSGAILTTISLSSLISGVTYQIVEPTTLADGMIWIGN